VNAVNHAGILKAGRYRDERVEVDETNVALALDSFMIRLRLTEEALAAEYHPADEMRCPVHFCVGQEAVPAALSLLLSPEDYLFSHHRSHGYYLAKHAPMEALFAELYGKSTGANGGLAGSQDISYPGCNFFSGAILSGAVAISTGAALGLQLQKSPQVAVAGFGEAAADEGIFWETINYAAVAKLPVVFVCENNNYSVFSPQVKRHPRENLTARVETFGVRSSAVFGNDAMEVYRVLAREIAAARAGGGPAFVEAFTYRWSGHYGPAGDDIVGYRDPAHLAAWKENCPIELLEEAMRFSGAFDSGLKNLSVRNAQAEIDRCFAAARSAPFPTVSDWEALNRSSSSPLADKLLVEVERSDFDARQESKQIVGY
jgi:TPP-dependent pyruvate/acetoin dehydrogenase alpha subunit